MEKIGHEEFDCRTTARPSRREPSASPWTVANSGIARRREGSYLLRSNLTGDNPALLWQHYIQLTEVEQAFKELKGDLSIRPVHHQTDAPGGARKN